MTTNHTGGAHRRDRRRGFGWSHSTKIAAAVLGAALAGGAAYAVTNWGVGLATGSGGEAQSGSVQNISITAVATPSATNLLYPGGSGDVVAKITNPNNAAVTITGVNLPANTVQAAGFSDSGLSSAQSGCSSTTSGVTWSFATGVSGSAHTLTAPITVAAASTMTITFTNDASMSTSAPAACESTYFQMPSLTGVVASAGVATATVATTDAWTS